MYHSFHGIRGRRALLGAFAAAAALCLTACETAPKSDPGSGQPDSEFDQGSVPPTPPSRGSGSGGQDLASVLQPVYFDFDRSDLRSDARPVLRSNAEAIQGNRQWGSITVEGHCDERGSDEYNLALGQRRADAVRQYLVDLGVPASRLETVSFGESKPAVMGHSESAYRYNRRSEFAQTR